MTSRILLVSTTSLLLSLAPASHSAVLPDPAELPSRAMAPEPRRVEVELSGTVTAARLTGAGLDVIDLTDGHATVLEWAGDAARLAALGAVVRVVDEHPGRTAARIAEAELASAPASGFAKPEGSAGVTLAPPYGGGSMGGYWTTNELKQKLDDWVAGDTHDVVADKIDTVGTSREGRPIWALQLGKHVTGTDTRPVVYYNALTHAREPGGMLTLCYFIDDLLSRYGSDPFATYLLDQRRIVICPLVNPDGYRINENTYFGTASFGLWRKNTRDNNGNGTFQADSDGVDLNRNYGFKWAYDNVGSSPSSLDETYRGPSAFSEQETRVQRDLITALSPKTGLSFHTYQDLLLHPWGYTTSQPVDAAAFHEWNDMITHDNAYQSGQSGSLLYAVNGEFNDWCYGDTTAKPRAFTWTPEVGSSFDGFWPPPSRIVPLAQVNLRSSYVVAAIAGAFVQTDGWSIAEGALNASRGAHLSVRARNLGVGTAGPGLVATITPLDSAVRILVGTVPYPTLASRSSGDPLGGASFEMVVRDTVTPGRPVRFQIQFGDASGLVSRDTVMIPLGTPTIVASDDASSGMGKWTVTPAGGTWGIVQNDPAHPSRYFTDSPGGTYGIGSTNTMTLTTPVNLSAGVHAWAVYDARWDVEHDFDAGVVDASLNGSTWVNLRASGSTPGSGHGVQTAGSYYYGGTRWQWRTDWADLSSYTGAAGTTVKIRYRLRSDGTGNFDGLSLDSVRILLYDPAAQPALVAVGPAPATGAAELANPWPNPAGRVARFEFALPTRAPTSLEVLDLQGRIVRTLSAGVAPPGRYVRQWDLTDAAGHRTGPGVYFVRLSTPEIRLTRRVVVIQ